MVPLTLLVLKVGGFKVTARLLERLCPADCPPGAPELSAIDHMVDVVLSNYRLRVSCLAKALVVFFVARSEGCQELELVLGVQADPVFSAHAWVNQRNRPLVGDVDSPEKYRRIWGRS